MKNAISRRNRDENLSEFREHAQKCPNSPNIPEIVQIFKKNPCNFRDFSKNSIKNSIYSIQSLVPSAALEDRASRELRLKLPQKLVLVLGGVVGAAAWGERGRQLHRPAQRAA